MAGARQGPLKIKLEFKVDAEAWDALRALYADTISRLEREAQVDARVLDLQMSGEIGDDMRMTAQQAYTALSSVYSESYGRPVDRAEGGQIWQVGPHRIMCGDSTSEEDVRRLMGGALVPLSVSDPPYNVAQDTQLYGQDVSPALKSLAKSEWDYGFDPLVFLEVVRVFHAKDCWQYIFTSHHLFGSIFDWLNSNYRRAIFCVWCKSNPMPSLSKRTWTWATELCLFGRNGSPVFNSIDGKHSLNWWDINKQSDGTHPTQKPVELIRNIVEHCSSGGDIVADFFLGSGTTAVACEQTGRICYGMEIEPKYVAVTLQRLADMGLEPELTNE